MSGAGAPDAPLGWWARAWTGLKCAAVAPMVGTVVFVAVMHLDLGSRDGIPWDDPSGLALYLLSSLGFGYGFGAPPAYFTGLVAARRLRRRPTAADLATIAAVGAVAAAAAPLVLAMTIAPSETIRAFSDPSVAVSQILGTFALAGVVAAPVTAWLLRPRAPGVPASR